jgi:uncharacterized membrane protein YgcG
MPCRAPPAHPPQKKISLVVAHSPGEATDVTLRYTADAAAARARLAGLDQRLVTAVIARLCAAGARDVAAADRYRIREAEAAELAGARRRGAADGEDQPRQSGHERSSGGCGGGGCGGCSSGGGGGCSGGGGGCGSCKK